MQISTSEFIEVAIIGTSFGFGFSALFGLLGYAMQSIKRVLFST